MEIEHGSATEPGSGSAPRHRRSRRADRGGPRADHPGKGPRLPPFQELIEVFGDDPPEEFVEALATDLGVQVFQTEEDYEKARDAPLGASLDLTPSAIERTSDPVRMYLREMGVVPLLDREGEVRISKRIERGRTGPSGR